jgi:hypothetical protein
MTTVNRLFDNHSSSIFIRVIRVIRGSLFFRPHSTFGTVGMAKSDENVRLP